MAVLVVASLKGGVGKTTCATHVAHGLARAGYQTLLVDGDVSSNASRFFGVRRTPEQSGVLDFLKPLPNIQALRDAESLSLPGIPERSIAFEVRQHLDLLPNNRDIDFFSRRSYSLDDSVNSLRDNLQLLANLYSFVVVDTAPDLNPLTRGAFAAADNVIVPVDSGAMSIEALEDLLRWHDRDSINWWVLRNLVSRRATRTNSLVEENLSFTVASRQADENTLLGYLRRKKVGLLETKIHRSEIANQLSHTRKTAFDTLTPNSLTDDYYQLVTEIIYFSSLASNQSFKQVTTLRREEQLRNSA
ncbi:MAG: ParA family protein [Bdellovibrionales bacterium]|nr:ParA family protein [Bdellovibrionales bacterium]